ncbi:MAG: helix-turn-helix transcriptional regulator [Solirubrobacteraceae bacterium]
MSDDRVAGDLIEKIRGISGLTQAELARRTGMQSSVLSAYEHGRRQPSAAALARIARAAGLELELAPAAHGSADDHAGRILSRVLDFAGSMPYRPRPELEYPPLIRLRP